MKCSVTNSVQTTSFSTILGEASSIMIILVISTAASIETKLSWLEFEGGAVLPEGQLTYMNLQFPLHEKN